MRALFATVYVVLATAPAWIVAPATAQSALTLTFSTYEPGMNRPGSDIKGVKLLMSGYPDLCASTCRVEPGCLSWTFVEAGVMAPGPMCWLKSAVPGLIPDPVATSGMITESK